MGNLRIVLIGLLFLAVLFSAAPVFAAHDNNASLEPEWSPAGQNVDYAVEICNVPDGGDSIDEVRIYKNVNYTDFVANGKTGWYLGEYNPIKQYYPYTATSSDYYIDLSECTEFTFSATTPPSDPDKCDLQWQFETRDITYVWKFAYDTTGVDDLPPSLYKEVSDPKYGVCPPGEGEDCWIAQSTQINIYVTEEGECGVSGLDWCEITYTINGGEPIQEVYEDLDGEESWEYQMSFDEDSVHVLTVKCADVAGNLLEDVETFKVDSEPPETAKEYGDPNKPAIYDLPPLVNVHYITPQTTITLTPTDPEPQHASGVAETYYIVKVPCEWEQYPEEECDQPEWIGLEDHEIYHDEKACYENNQGCEITWWNVKWELTDGWTQYKGPFVIPQESIHKICFYSIDEVRNEEAIKCQIAIVDDTPPISSKEIGDPKSWDDVGTLGNAVAEWTTDTSYSGAFSVLLSADGDLNPGAPHYAYVKTPSSTAFSGISDISFYYKIAGDAAEVPDLCTTWPMYCRDGTSFDDGYFSPYIVLSLDKDGDGGSADKWIISQQWAEDDITGDWIQWNMADASLAYPNAKWHDEAFAGGWQDLSDFQTLYPDAIVLEVKAAIGMFAISQWQSSYADDLEIDSDIIISEPAFTWVTQDTPIILDCQDQEPHPVGQETLYWRFSLWEDGFGGEPNYSEWYSAPDTEFPVEIHFPEDSWHDLEYYCVDHLGNTEQTHTQYYIVESVPPKITKQMFGSWLGDCPPQEEGDECFVADDGSSGVEVFVKDPQPHPVNEVWCEYELWWEGRIVDSGEFSDYAKITFYNDSKHTLNIYCRDALGNSVEDTEVFLVDSNPPETEKWYGEPYKVEPQCYDRCKYDYDGDFEECIHNYCTWWINSSTPITLIADDEKVDVDKTLYLNVLAEDYQLDELPCREPEQYCQPMFLSPPTECVLEAEEQCGYDPQITSTVECVEDYIDEVCFDGEANFKWQVYTEPFNKSEESCHILEYYSIDKLGNTEDVKVQCFFVDNTPPISDKKHGTPFIEDEGFSWVTKETPIWLTCSDQEPHPVGQETLRWRFSFYENGFEDNPTYTDWYSAPYTEFPVEIYFPEDSWHDLEYYCVDHLGNDERDLMQGEPHRQYYIVESMPPVITKEMFGSWLGDCPPQEEGDECYIDGITEIHVNATDPEPHPVNDVLCEWHYEVEGTDISGGQQAVKPPFIIKFPEESKHHLWITCWDALDNSTRDYEVFFVDKTPPETWKRYGKPFFENDNGEWITSDTEISLYVEDAGPHKTGINETKYRITQVPDLYCNKLLDTYCAAEGSGDWQTYSGQPFKILEQSCHKIEYYSTDNVDKKEDTKYQCVFVDNSAPTPEKTVGEPKEMWTPGQNGDPESYFYPEETANCDKDGILEAGEIECWQITMMTPIDMNCTDPEPHPVKHESVCYKVDLDGEDVTADYCGEELNNEGYCCVESPIENFTFWEESEHNLKYYCEDSLGNRGPEDEEKFKVEGTTFRIPLHKKWNLVSVPFVLLSDSPQDVFEDIAEDINSVWAYDGETGKWYVYHPSGPPGDLNSIEPGWGYWVLAMEDTELLIGGSLFSPATLPPSRQLVKGWNLIGYYGTQWQEYEDTLFCGDGYDPYGSPVYCSLNSLIDTQEGYPRWSSLWAYRNCGLSDMSWEPLATCGDPPYDTMFAGRGYWVEMDVPDIYAPATDCIWDSDLYCVGMEY